MLFEGDLNKGSAEKGKIAINSGGEVFVTYADNQEGGKASAMKYSGTKWSPMGAKGFTNSAPQQDMVLGKYEVPYLAYADGGFNEKLSVKRYKDLLNPANVEVKGLENDDITVFPNPTLGMVFVDLKHSERVKEVSVINISGEVLSTTSATGQSILSLDLPAESGFYVLVVTLSNGECINKRISKF
jgi:hypothetical protein